MYLVYVVVMLWGVLLVIVLLGGVFINLGTCSNFNCSFTIWESDLSFDGVNLIVVFVVFELEVVIVLFFVSGLGIIVLLVITIIELGILYV